MKALLLCGGFATRMGILGEVVPKPLVDVGGKPVLSHTMESLEKMGDLDEIIISANEKFGQSFRNWIRACRTSKKITLVVEPAAEEGEKLGAVAGIRYALENTGVDDDLLLILGDNIFSFDLSEFVAYFKTVGVPCHIVYDIGSREKAKLYGVPTLHGQLIAQILEKPQFADSSVVCTGIYAFPRNSLHHFGEYLDISRSHDRPGDFLAWLVKQVPVHAFHANGVWFDVGNLESLEEARMWAKEK